MVMTLRIGNPAEIRLDCRCASVFLLDLLFRCFLELSMYPISSEFAHCP